MQFPTSTGQAAQFLGTTEPRLAETVRRGRIKPAPPIIAGRRLWTLDQLLKAAEVLGLASQDLVARLHAAATGERP